MPSPESSRPLPESGPLSLLNISDEYGGGAPHSLDEYYAGGPHVPPGTAGINGPIPSSGALAISDFYGSPLGGNVNIDCIINSRRGPDTDLWGVGNGGTGGYDYVYQPGDYPYGSIASGNDVSSEGWSFWGFTILQQKGGGPWMAVLHMDSASFGTRRFRLTADGGELIFDTNDADGSELFVLESAIGPVEVWQTYWLPPDAPEFWTDWTSGTHHIFIERI